MYSIMIVEDEYLVRQGIASLVDYEQFGKRRKSTTQKSAKWAKILAANSTKKQNRSKFEKQN